MEDLGFLFQPLSEKVFWEKYWQRTSLFMARQEPTFLQSLFTYEALDRLIGFSLTNEGIRATKDDMTFPLRPKGKDKTSICEFYDLHFDGHTLIIEDLHLRWKPLAQLANAINRQTGLLVGMELFVLPPGSTSVTVGGKKQETIALALEGSLAWSVPQDADLIPASGLTQETPFVQQSGETFYFPAKEHYCLNTPPDAPALCLVLTIVNKTWADALIEAVGNHSQKDVRLRRALPYGAPLRFDDEEKLALHFQELLGEVVQNFDWPKVKAHFSIKLKEMMAPLPDGHFTQIRHIDDVALDTAVESRPGATGESRIIWDRSEFQFPGDVQTGPDKLFLALDFIRDTQQFKVGDIPGWYSDSEKIMLVKHLLRKGYLRISS